MTVHESYTCDDGSGSFDVDVQNRYDFATFDSEGQHDVGTWTIVGGTEAYDGLSGTGDIALDFGEGTVTRSGEVEAP